MRNEGRGEKKWTKEGGSERTRKRKRKAEREKEREIGLEKFSEAGKVPSQ